MILKQVKRVKIKKSRWLRGSPRTRRRLSAFGSLLSSALLDDKGYMCCLGFWGEQCGVPREVLLCRGFPGASFGLYPGLTYELETDLAEINDSCSNDYPNAEAKRKALNQACKKHGSPVRFVFEKTT